MSSLLDLNVCKGKIACLEFEIYMVHHMDADSAFMCLCVHAFIKVDVYVWLAHRRFSYPQVVRFNFFNFQSA